MYRMNIPSSTYREKSSNWMKDGICFVCNQPGASSMEIILHKHYVDRGKEPNSHIKCILPKTMDELKQDLRNNEVHLNDILSYLILEYRFSYVRDLWLNHWKSWVFPPTYDQIQRIINIVGVNNWIEVGAGSGFLSAIFKKAGVNFLSVSDIKLGEFGAGFINNIETFEPYVEMEELSANDVLERYKRDNEVLLISWAKGAHYGDIPNDSSLKYILHIGEDEDGCTYFGTPSEEHWEVIDIIDTPTWDEMLHDCLTIYKKK